MCTSTSSLCRLQVTIKYIDFHGTPRELKRYFKFEVHNPFATTLSTVPAQSHLSPLSTGTVVNAVMRNVTSDAICLGTAAFKCAPHCTATELQRTILPKAPRDSAESQLPQWLQQAGPRGAPGGAPLPAWHPRTANAAEPLLVPGQEVEYSFLVVRNVVSNSTSGEISGNVEDDICSQSSGAVAPAGYDHTRFRVVKHADATLGRVELSWTAHMGELGQWHSASVASSASCPQLCHIVAPRTLRGTALEAAALPVSVTHLPSTDGIDAVAPSMEYVLRVRCKDSRGCAVVGDEVKPTASLDACQVAATNFQLLPLAPGAYRLEVVVSPQVAEQEAVGQHECDRPISEGRHIAWNTVDFVVK